MKDSAVGAGDIVSNDERNVRRWRLGQLGFITEAALWMLVVNAVACEERARADPAAPAPSPVERRLLHEELVELFDTRLDEHASLWENLVCIMCGCFVGLCSSLQRHACLFLVLG